MFPETGVKTLPSVSVAYLVRTGDYGGVADAFRIVESWAIKSGLEVTGPPVLVYWTNPAGLPAAAAGEWEIQLPVAGGSAGAKEEGGPRIKQLTEREVVFTVSRGGYTTAGLLLPALFQVVYNRGYRLAGPAEEVYPADFPEVPVDEVITEVRFPVVPQSRR
ncbi:MAG: GyrI-like domain-containing protein [Bacillota bacterium]